MLFAEGLADPGARLSELTLGVDQLRRLAQPFTPEAVAVSCGIPAETIRRMGRKLAAALRGAVYGREVLGELPVACLAEEIDTPGEGQVKALITLAGNPARSTPNSERLEAALGDLELMVSIDVYVNETTRHADVILPAPSPLHHGRYDLVLYLFAVRNVAHYSPPVLDPEPGVPDERMTLLRLAGVIAGLGPRRRRRRARRGGGAGGHRPGARHLRLTPGGTHPGERAGGAEAPGRPRAAARPDAPRRPIRRAQPRAPEVRAPRVDLGPLQARLPDALRTPSGTIELAPPAITADVPRLRARLDDGAGAGELVLVGHRHDGARQGIAAAHAGTNSNALADERFIDAVSGNAVLNGIPVTLAPVAAAVV